MFTRFIRAACAASVAILWACPALAETTLRGDAITFSAHVTASRLRHRWDDARSKDVGLGNCLAPKVSEAMMLISRIDQKRALLRDGDAVEKVHAARVLEILDARRAELETESTACSPHAYEYVGATKVTMSIKRTIANVEPVFGPTGDADLLRAFNIR